MDVTINIALKQTPWLLFEFLVYTVIPPLKLIPYSFVNMLSSNNKAVNKTFMLAAIQLWKYINVYPKPRHVSVQHTVYHTLTVENDC